ncbi:hypothetical protein FGU46_07775 [Methanobacterium sp. CWC-01]|uniref:hypothetical protein n=1 Tax=Methanobacterium aridiramus TaxID=2584467 RepID=UPI0025766B72|nr:hypothetical protein [Methanobacterium sp. CWC-01]WJI09993.1 hypothetical protein FGU46_07775 [Methanobacterium sp. CWC-01]
MEKLTLGLIFMIILMVGFISYLVATMNSGEITMNTTNLSTSYFSGNHSTNITTRVNNTRSVTKPTSNDSNNTDRARVNYYKKSLGIT